MGQLDDHLRRLAEVGGDLHICPGLRPSLRSPAGQPVTLGNAEPVRRDAAIGLLKTTTPARRDRFEQTGSVRFVTETSGLGRFRVHAFRERRGAAANIRYIPSEVPTSEELSLPPQAMDALVSPRGLFVVTGRAGSGRTNTLSALLQELASAGRQVISLEDLIEFCLGSDLPVHQCEAGSHSRGPHEALAASALAGAEVIALQGSIDGQTFMSACEAAESGSLVLIEGRWPTAASGVKGLIGLVRREDRDRARELLAEYLTGVLAQTLVPTTGEADGPTAVPAFGLLLGTAEVASAIENGDFGRLPSAIQSGGELGMALLEDSLADLVAEGTVSFADASRAAPAGPGAFRRRCEASGIPVDEERKRPRRRGRRAVFTRRMSRAAMFAREQRSEDSGRPRSRRAGFEEEVGQVAAVEAPAAQKLPDWADPRVVAGRQILVVDDDDQVRSLLARMLSAAGARVKATGDAHVALSEARAGGYDMVTLDILMPDMSGTELYDRLLSASPALAGRTLFISGCASSERMRARIGARGGRLLSKPFERDDLLRAAASVIVEK